VDKNELTPDRPTLKVQITLDAPTLLAIERAAGAKRPMMSRSNYVREALREKLEREK